jgi:hypothetical protein
MAPGVIARSLNAINFALHRTGSSRFSLVSMVRPLAAAPGQ